MAYYYYTVAGNYKYRKQTVYILYSRLHVLSFVGNPVHQR